MRPVLLEIKGFNSFREKQVIDFEKLTSKGLFGIFGPTGSGKSSILDGIIYALYGSVPREQNSFINSNENESSVTLKFVLGKGASAKTYIITRSVRLSKTGKYNTPSIRLYEENSNEILADKVTSANKVIEELIGLKAEDFTRAVVLPQGKFSEFLKMTPGTRNDMLERIFGLEKYGRQLTDKIKSESNENKSQITFLSGRLEGYENVTEESLELLKNEFNVLKNSEATLISTEKSFKTQYEQLKEVYRLTQELSIGNEKLSSLRSREEEIERIAINLSKAQRASQVKPTYDEVIALKKDMLRIINQLESTTLQLDEALISSDILSKKLKQAQLLQVEEIPLLKIKESKLIEAQKTEKELILKNEELAELQNNINIGNENLNKYKSKLEERSVLLNKCRQDLSELDLQINQNSISSSQRNKITNGYELQKEINHKNDILSQKKILSKSIKSELEETNNQTNNLKCKFTDIEKLHAQLQEELKILKEGPVATEQDIIDLTNEINDCKLRIETISATILEEDKLKQDYEELSRDIRALQENLTIQKEGYVRLESDFNNFKTSIEAIKLNNLASTIASSLKQGDECPVCGNENHKKLATTADLDELLEIENKLNIVELEMESVDKSISGVDVQLKVKIEQKTSVESKLLNLNKYSTEELEHEKNNLTLLVTKEIEQKETRSKVNSRLESLNNQERSVQGELSLVSQKLSVSSTNSLNLEKQLSFIMNEIDILKNEIISIEKQLELLGTPENYLVQFQELKQRDVKLETLNEKKKTLDSEKDNLDKEIDDLNKYISEIRIAEVQLSEKKKALLNEIELKLSQIKILCIDKSVDDELLEVRNQINSINENVINLSNALDKITNIIKNIETEKITLKTQFENNSDRTKLLENILIELLEKHNFSNENEVFEAFAEENQQAAWKIEIDSYNTGLNNILAVISSIQGKLGNQKCTDEDWLELESRRLSLESKIKEIHDLVTLKAKEITTLKDRLNEVKEIQAEYDLVRGKQNKIDQLLRLLQGNKFVEFIAMSQLNYVAREASNRLYDITKGKFNLILDKDTGSFLIQDNASGGHKRSTDSLSGGELFLTSLSLALALSSHIQLKNSAPLEFFFLDEGFGTLDDNILETAMASLEKLHSENLSVGIISHVKEIQERIPVKLVVSPAKLGEGSKVKLL
ncbi:MAG: putative exonuclease [Bacillales bacterium]|jgi:exonuclease SbcC|nr:putative exonuclease [Bacillales bacterium]